MGLLVLLGFAVWGYLNWYVNNHKEEILSQVENLANESLMGQVHFDSISLSSIKKFPDLALTVHNFTLTDSLYEKHHKKTVFIKRVHASASVLDLWEEKLKINEVDIQEGEVNLFVDTDHYTNTYVFKPRPKEKKQKGKSSLEIVDDYIAINIEQIEFWFRERIKNKRITALIHEVDFDINPQNKETLIPEIDLDISMKELGLNLDNGSFFNERRVTSTIIPNIDTEKNTMDTDWFDMKIGALDFYNQIFINFKEGSFKFHLTIEEANFKETVHLLSQNIQKKLNIFDLQNPVQAEATIEGKFEYKNNPVVWVKYDTEDNTIQIPDQNITLKKANLHGTFINRIYKDPEHQKTESVKNFLLSLDTFNAEYEGIPYSVNQSQVYGTNTLPTVLNVHLKAAGSNKNLSKLINSENFRLETGDFSLQSDLKGAVHTLSDIFTISTTKIQLQNCRTLYIPENVAFQLNEIKLSLDKKETLIDNISISLPNAQPIRLYGKLNSFASFFDENIKERPFTHLYVRSNYLDLNTILRTFTQPIDNPRKDDTQEDVNLRVLKNSLRGIMRTFNPELDVYFKKFKLFGQEYKEVSGVVKYQKNNLKIENLKGSYKDKGKGSLDLSMNLKPLKDEEQKETLDLQYKLSIDGKIEDLVKILKNDNFFFKDSHYSLFSEFQGQANSFKDLMKSLEMDVSVGKGTMYYKNVGLNFRYDTLSVRLKDDQLSLKQFKLLLPEEEFINFLGDITHFSHLFDDTDNQQIQSKLSLQSPRLNLNNFIFLFNNNSKPNEEVNLKKTLKDLYSRYQPSLNISVDHLEYNSNDVKDFSTQLHFKNSNEFELKNTAFSLFDDKISLQAGFDLSQKTTTPFQAELRAKQSNIVKILQAFDNFKFSTLENPAEITGTVSVDAQLQAIIDDKKGVRPESIVADADVVINKLRIKNFEPIINIGNIIFKKERLEDIKVLPLEVQLSVRNQKLFVEKTAIQSSAFDAYIMGVIDNQTETDLWIAIPWENFKKRNYDIRPEMRSEQDLGKKLYLQIISDQAGKLHYKLRLNKHKYEEAEKKFGVLEFN